MLPAVRLLSCLLLTLERSEGRRARTGVGLPLPPSCSFGLSELWRFRLSPEHAALLEEAGREMEGSPRWRAWKLTEAWRLLVLSEIAPPGRLTVEHLSLDEDLYVQFRLQVPVWRRLPKGRFEVAEAARLALRYPCEAVVSAQPGCRFLRLRSPQQVWLGNVSWGEDPRLCVAPWLPAGIPAQELVLAAYGALSLQAVDLEQEEPGRALNPEAAAWWKEHRAEAPLTQTPFLRPEA